MPIRTVWDAANENDGASSSGVAGAPTKQRLSLIRDGSSVREVGLAAVKNNKSVLTRHTVIRTNGIDDRRASSPPSARSL